MSLSTDVVRYMGDFMSIISLGRSCRVNREWRECLIDILKKRLANLSYQLIVSYFPNSPINAYMAIGPSPRLLIDPLPKQTVMSIRGELDETWWPRLAKQEIRLSWENRRRPPYLVPIFNDEGETIVMILEIRFESIETEESVLHKRSRDEYEYEGYPDELSSDV